MAEGRETLADRLGRKLEQHGLTDRAVSLEVTEGKDPDLVRDMMRRGRVPKGNKLARLAARLRTTQDWLLDGGDEAEAAREASFDPLVMTEVAHAREAGRDYNPYERQPLAIPHVGSAVGGDFGDLDEHIELTELNLSDVISWRARPPELQGDPHAYDLTVVGDSMDPLFRSGVDVTVSPRAPVAIGDNVIVQLRGRGGEDDRVKMVLIKQLVRRSAAFVELRQFNPDRIFQVPVERIALDARGRPAIHKVVAVRF